MRAALVLGIAITSLSVRGGPPNYDAFSDRDGHIHEKHVVAAQTMVRDPEQLEIVYADAAKGNARAARVFQELETHFFPEIGREVAERTSGPDCLVPVYRELSGQCIPNWGGLDFLRDQSEAGRRLRKAVADAYAARARERGVQNQAILSAMGALLAVTVARSAIVQVERAAVTGVPSAAARSTLPGVPGRVQSRINLMTGNAEEGWSHVLKEHLSGKTGKSQFTIPEGELRALLESREVVQTLVTRTLSSSNGIRYVREFEANKIIGTDKFAGYQPTRVMTILTDTSGNLVTASPGIIR